MRDEVDGSYYIESSQTKGNKITLIAQANSHNFCARLFWRKRKRGNVADASARVDVECAKTLTESVIILCVGYNEQVLQ